MFKIALNLLKTWCK